jgi:5-methylcytosine-specific restriction endonuclease McrA
MTTIRSKHSPKRLDPLSYEAQRESVLRRDGWRCQSCGWMSNLEVHHNKLRSRQGDDSEVNLVTLCTVCQEELVEALQLY